MGVDMFFVISGYLITSIILRDISVGRFSFSEFYRRRIKRIFPTMILVTGTTLVAGLLILLPEDVEALSWSALATLLSAANIYFTYFLNTSYFAADSATVPLLHMWSLGVEEQFYLFWPALLLVLLKWPRFAVPVLVCIGASSVWLGEWLLRTGRHEWAYYMLPTRSFQLAIGGLLAFLPITRLADRVFAPFLLALAGAFLCLASAIALASSHAPYPGVNALPVTLGTAMLLAAGASTNPISRLLSWTPLRWIGLISYSLYLWHWPVLAFQRYFYPELSVRQQIASFLVMLALAWLSYRFVERPARSSTNSLRQVWMTMAAAPSSVVTILAVVLIGTAGVGPWTAITGSDGGAGLSAAEPPYKADYVCQGTLTEEMVQKRECAFSLSGSEPTVLLWGDSNAAHYVGAIRGIAASIGMGFRNFAVSACPPVFNGPDRFTNEKYRDACKASSEVARPVVGKYDGVMLAARWDSYINVYGSDFVHELESTVDTLRQAGRTVMVLGVTPIMSGYDRLCERKYNKFPYITCGRVVRAGKANETNEQLKRLAEARGALYVDFNDILCNNGRCTSRKDDVLTYYDSGHLSIAGSEMLGELAKMNNKLIDKFRVLVSAPKRSE